MDEPGRLEQTGEIPLHRGVCELPSPARRAREKSEAARLSRSCPQRSAALREGVQVASARGPVLATPTQMGGKLVLRFGLERLRAGPPVRTLTDMLKRIDRWVRMSKTPVQRCGVPGRAGTDRAERSASRAGGQDAKPPATPAVRSAHSGSSYPARVTAALGSAAAATIRACVLNP